jgi:hypothetical protein
MQVLRSYGLLSSITLKRSRTCTTRLAGTQGEQHFIAIKAWGGAAKLRQVQMRDQHKRSVCRDLGITLVEVPYSWDGSEEHIVGLLEAGYPTAGKELW